MKQTIAILVIATGMVALGVGQVKSEVRPILQYTGGATANSVPLRLTAGTQATVTGFTVTWRDINNNPVGSCNFSVSMGNSCSSFVLRPGQFVDFIVGPIVNSICQIYPENTEGLAACTTYQFNVQLNPPYNVRSNRAIQQTTCP